MTVMAPSTGLGVGSDPAPLSFDILGPLPTGTTVLEASAGTGKTHAIGALVVTVRRRGGGRARPGPRRDVRPGGKPGAARASARPPARGRAGTGGSGRRAGGRRLGAPVARHGHRRRGGAAPAAVADRARRVRRRDDRHDPPVLSPRAHRARHRRRHDRRRRAGRRPRRPGGRGGRRPVRACVRRVERRRPDLQPRRRAGARACGGERPAHAPRARSSTVGRARRRGPARAVRCGSAPRSGAAQAFPAHPRLRRLARPARRLAARRGCGGQGPDARPLVHRPRRRIPGHRSRPVDDHRAGVRGPRDRRPRRRSEAVDLRVPRRGRHDLPRRERPRRDPLHLGSQLAQRRAGRAIAARPAGRRRARRPRHPGPARHGRSTGTPPGGGPVRGARAAPAGPAQGSRRRPDRPDPDRQGARIRRPRPRRGRGGTARIGRDVRGSADPGGRRRRHRRHPCPGDARAEEPDGQRHCVGGDREPERVRHVRRD